MKICKDCVTEWEAFPEPKGPVTYRPRPAPHPGPRCATHHGAAVKAAKQRAHETRVGKVYGLPPGAYERLYEAQGGVCAICRRARGIKKKLAVDHDHETGLVYGLLCGPCNKDVMGRARRDVAYFVRCIQYLDNPPAKQLGIVAYHQDTRKEES